MLLPSSTEMGTKLSIERRYTASERSSANDDQVRPFWSFFKWAILGLFFVFLGLFKQTTEILQQINLKNVHPVSGAGIRTHELIMSRLL